MSKRTRGNSGSIIFEFAIVVPVFLLMILGGMDLLLATTAKSNLSYVAQETAACAARTPSKCTDVSAYANSLAQGIGLRQTVGVSQNACSPASPKCVSITAQVTTRPVGPFFPSITLVSTAQATGGGGGE